jgi:hypothetical protein
VRTRIVPRLAGPLRARGNGRSDSIAYPYSVAPMDGDIVGGATRIRRVPWAVTETVAGETVLLDPVGDRYLRLNATGAALWELLADPRSPRELAAALSDRHALDDAVATRDAAAFLDALRARELVQDT